MARPIGLNYVQRPNETEGRSFGLNGLHEILVMLPQGETWPDGAEVVLQFESPHDDEEDFWQDILDPKTQERVACWANTGFVPFNGSPGIRYRLKATETGFNGTIKAIRSWVSSRPGR